MRRDARMLAALFERSMGLGEAWEVFRDLVRGGRGRPRRAPRQGGQEARRRYPVDGFLRAFARTCRRITLAMMSPYGPTDGMNVRTPSSSGERQKERERGRGRERESESEKEENKFALLILENLVDKVEFRENSVLLVKNKG